jgi:muconate cycloisomerase
MSIRLDSITTTVVDLPTRRPHGFSTTTMSRQSLVIVQARTVDGLEGVGEGVTPGGPWWSGESVETIKVMIDTYLAPAVLALPDATPRAAARAMNRTAARAWFAKAAVEMALWDLVGKASGLPVATLLGGALRTEVPITWALSASDAPAVLADAEARLDEGYTSFKFKMGALPMAEDVARVVAVAEKLPQVSSLVVDPNGSWDEHDTARALRVLADAGVRIAEQPTPAWNVSALRRLRDGSTVRLMADESAQSPDEMSRLVTLGAVDSVSLKVPKAGGIGAAAAMAEIAAAGGIAVYGGSTLEGSIGASAAVQLYASWPDLIGCELVGPALMTHEVVTEPLTYRNGMLQVPTGPGLGVEIDDEKLRFHARH